MLTLLSKQCPCISTKPRSTATYQGSSLHIRASHWLPVVKWLQWHLYNLILRKCIYLFIQRTIWRQCTVVFPAPVFPCITLDFWRWHNRGAHCIWEVWDFRWQSLDNINAFPQEIVHEWFPDRIMPRCHSSFCLMP